MSKTGKPFCHEHSGAMLGARVATATAAARAMPVVRALAIVLGILLLAAATSPATALPRAGAAAAPKIAPQSTCGLLIDVSRPSAGVTISASGVTPVQTFSVYLEPQLLGRLTSDASGHLAGRLDLPPATRGPQMLRVGSANCAVEIGFDADAGPPNGPPPPPPPQQPISASAPVRVGLSNDLRYGLITLVGVTAVLMLLLTSRLGRRTSTHN